MRKEKILIIKTGYSEVLDGIQDSRIVSLGDVIRTTPLLHLFAEDNVTWVTATEAYPLLENNPLINRLLHLDFINALQLESEEFDRVINLEKIPGICALSDKIRARRSRYGFTFDSQTGKAEALDRAYEVLAVSFDQKCKKENQRYFQDLLFEMVGKEFNGEEYVLGYRPQTKENYDIGFNVFVGSKWPSKSWSKNSWDKLESLLVKDRIKVTRQDKQPKKILKDIHPYIDWLNKSKLIITNDSLGLHLAIALKKKILGLFGPTHPREIYFYGRGKAILPEERDECMPCFAPQCKKYSESCMSKISPEMVADKIKSFYL